MSIKDWFSASLQPRLYAGQEAEDYLNGFRTGYPLDNQPEYPAPDSEAYRHGLTVGKWLTFRMGLPGVPYEEEGED